MSSATIKVKHKGKWVNPDDLPTIREAEQKPAEPPPAVDVSVLPKREDLDPDVPLEQLFYERPEIRAYITKDGKVRSGLKPAERTIAEDIIKRYGGQA